MGEDTGSDSPQCPYATGDASSARLGPISKGQALAMATLARCFSPVNLLRERTTCEDPLLHPLWVSGVILRELEAHGPPGRVIRPEIVHVRHGCLGDTLRVLTEMEVLSGGNRAVRLKLTAMNQDGDLLATGSAEVEP